MCCVTVTVGVTVNEYVLQHCDSGVAYVTVISGVLCHSDRWLSCHLFVYISKNYLIRELLIVLTSRDASLFAHMWVDKHSVKWGLLSWFRQEKGVVLYRYQL